jgi:transposase InsO family protein
MNIHQHARTTPRSRECLVQRVARGAESVRDVAEALGVSDRTVRKWVHRYRTEGRAGLQDRSCRPRRQPTATAPELVAWIVRLRRQRWTGAQIARALGRSRATVARVLQRHRLNRLRALAPAVPVQRYEYAQPGGLVHLDIKKLGRIGRIGHRITGDRRSRVRGIGWEYVHVAVDDATRLAYVEVLPDEQGVTVTAFLWRALAWYRRLGIRVRRLLTDNGAGYLSHVFAQCCAGARLRHLRTRPYTPRTNGKAERFIQTLLREWAYIRAYGTSAERLAALPHWLHYYNVERRHAGLHDHPPISRLSRSSADNLVRLHT